MAKPYRSRPFLPRLTLSLRQRLARAERGQAIVIIAMAIFGLLIFIGLTVDAGILFIGLGHLRRAVDAAALSAASQFREGRTFEEMEAVAKQAMAVNGIDEASVVVKTCEHGSIPNDPSDPLSSVLCGRYDADGNLMEPRRKIVYVEGSTPVDFAFLTLIGFHSVNVQASSRSEAASVDVVLVIDTSASMTNDAKCHNGLDDDGDQIPDDGCPDITAVGSPEDELSGQTTDWLDNDNDGLVDDGFLGPGLVDDRDDIRNNASLCNTLDNPAYPPFTPSVDGLPGECHPFEEVKAAASSFVDRLNFPFDRVAIVSFDLTAQLVLSITNPNYLSQGEISDLVKNLEVSANPGPTTCIYSGPGTDPSGCPNTSTGGGLKIAGGQFGLRPIRQESVWVVILLTDGAANASEPVDGYSGSGPGVNKYCPPTTWYQPFCRDPFNLTRHSVMTDTTHIYQNPNNSYDPVNYDADDFARDSADFVACADSDTNSAAWCTDSLNYEIGEGGQGAIIYAIGLGTLVVNFTACDTNHDGQADEADCNRDSGDDLLRYIAAVGDDGDAVTNPCSGVATPTLTGGDDTYNCGNYFFSEFGSGLNAVFESIASRIFTRITH